MERPRAEEYQPQLRRWSHLWRLLLAIALSCLVWLPLIEEQSAYSPWLIVLDLCLGGLSLVLVCFRRRHPVAVLTFITLLAMVSGSATGPAVLAAVSLASRRRWREIVPMAALSFGAALVFGTLYPTATRDPFWLTLSANAIATVAVFSWGMYVGSRRELIWTLKSRAERAESEQELRTSQARGTERARIAREMHDVLAHRISQISMHAGALAFREGLSAEEMRESAAVIQQKAHEALDDLRDVLGVLRDGADAGTLAPQPTYADLPQLVADARQEGVNVELHDELEGGELPDPVGRAVYRIVQEGLTNAHKHAPGAAVQIRLSGGPEQGLHLHLDNPLGFGSGTPGAGLGLVGLSERAALLGGRLEHRRDRSSFVLDTWIPWAA